MINRIWFWLLFIGIVYGFGKATFLTVIGADAVDPRAVAAEDADSPKATAPPSLLQQTGKELTGAALDAAELSIQLCLTLAGVMILWLGVLQVANDAGMVDALARALRPLMRWLFPDVPDGHPAQGAMLMNMSANMLGLDNAATPFGIKAMKELQELNPHKQSASNSMATFLAINTSSVTLVPISVIALRAAADSKSPAAPLGGILIATTLSTIAAIIAVRWLSRLSRFAVEPDSEPANEPQGLEGGASS